MSTNRKGEKNISKKSSTIAICKRLINDVVTHLFKKKRNSTEPEYEFIGLKNKVAIRQEEEKPLKEITNDKRVSVANLGGTVFLQDASDALYTYRLASCYAIIVVGQRTDGQKIAALCHWIGSDDSAEDTISKLKLRLKEMGAEEPSFETFAIGGHKSFPEPKKEIQELVAKKIIQQASYDLSEGVKDSASLVIRLNNKNEILIDYSVTKFAVPVEEYVEESKRFNQDQTTTEINTSRDRPNTYSNKK